MTTVEEIPLTKVKVGERYRKDYDLDEEFIESIKTKGIIQPITLSMDYQLLAGGRRFAAAQQLELSSVPVIRRKVTGRDDELEIELYENIYRKDLTWQERAALEKDLHALKSKLDPEWSLRRQAEETRSSKTQVGRRIELAAAVAAFPQLADYKTEDDAWKAYKKLEEKIVVGTMINDAKARALKGVKIAEKAYRIGDVLAGMDKLADGAYHFAEVDPPYAVDIDQRKSRNKQDTVADYNEIPREGYLTFIATLAEETFRVLQPNAFCIWWFGWDWFTDTHAALVEAGFRVPYVPAVWVKGQVGQTASPDTALGSCHEPFFICRKGQPKLAKPGRANVFDFGTVPPSQKIHPTERPLDLMVEILETFTWPGTRLVIPLLGSGNTLRACYRAGRIGFGWDLSQEYKSRFLARIAEDEDAEQNDAVDGRRPQQPHTSVG
jgi:adenine-specific DNA-methyltransferase